MKISDKLKKEVLKEALAIRKHATKDEISNLIAKDVNPDSIERCIYGKMTGNCSNDRAKVLLAACAKVALPKDIIYRLSQDYKLIDDKITGACDIRERIGNIIECYSPIETAIMMNKSIIPKIIRVIKGKSDTLD